ncbi:MAG: hypothetical protein CSA50_00615 [Gammaproteobacteria bacterium]|nr:MAG: hypothetical protein CSA50_00615 [Gammaproteobacteria bacterium]
MTGELLNDTEIDTLETYLFSPELEETAMDYFAVLGVMAAHVVTPKELSSVTLASMITGSSKHNSLPLDIAALLNKIAHSTRMEIEQDELLIIPTEPDSELDCISNWCGGFITYYLQDEARWMESDEELVAELLVPIMALSGLFLDEEPFNEIGHNESLLEEFCGQLPVIITDLYLHFHARKN